MRSLLRATLVVSALAAAPAWAQAPAPPADGSLFFNPKAGQWAHRSAGAAWLCSQGAACVAIRFNGVTPEQIAVADIASLGHADGKYFLALRHPEVAGGRQRAYTCTADLCQAAALTLDQYVFLGTYEIQQSGRPSGRAAILARSSTGAEPARLLWCSEPTCTNQALTVNNPGDFTLMGMGMADGAARVWLRDRSGGVFACGVAAGDADRFDCQNTGLNFPEPGAATGPTGPTGPTDPVAGETDPQSLLAAIEDALRNGNMGEAERLLSEGRNRFPDRPEWAQIDQRLASLRASRDNAGRFDQARRMIADARRFATSGDYGAAEAMLVEAGRIAPGMPEIAQARADIQRLRADRFQRLRLRSELVQAIEDAIRNFRFWEAEGLVGEALRRFPNDPDFRNFQGQVQQQRSQAEFQGRLRRARDFVAGARDAMNRLMFGDAERMLDQAEGLAGGLPEIRTARSDLARMRVEADFRAGEIRQFSADINAALARNQIAQAEAILSFALRRHPLHPGWGDFRRRIDAAKAAAPPPIPIGSLIGNARAAMARKDWPTAERLIVQAERADPANPAVRQARADLNGARNAAAAQANGFIATARTAMARRDWTTADAALAQAEAADPTNPAVRQLRTDLAAARGSAAGPALTLVNNARAAMANKDWAAAERLVVQAEAADPSNPAVRQVRADLNAQRSAADAQVKTILNGARAAFNAKDWAGVDRAIQQAQIVDPQNPLIAQARTALNDARTNAANQANGFIVTGRAAMAQRNWPAADAALASARTADPQNPAVARFQADLAAAKAAPPPPPSTAPMITGARTAMASKDWAAAERLVVQAEAADPNNPAVRQVRADLNAQRTAAASAANGFITTGRAAMAQRNWPAADAALASARTADPQNPAVARFQADLAAAKAAPPPANAAPLIASARGHMARKDWAAAERDVVAAERVDPANPAVRQVRADLTAQRNGAAAQANGFIATGRAAMAQRNWPAADAALASARAADPTNPAVARFQADLATAKAAPPPANPAPLIASARGHMARKDWAAAERDVVAAERIAAADPAVRQVRADLTAQRAAANTQARAILNGARGAFAAKNWPAVANAIQQAQAVDPQNQIIGDARTELANARNAAAAQAAPFVTTARAAIAANNEAAAKGNLAQANTHDPFGNDVVALRAQVKAKWP